MRVRSLRPKIKVPAALGSERLLIRPLVPGDAPAIFRAIDESRRELGEWLPWIPDVGSVQDLEGQCEACEFEWKHGYDFRVGIFTPDGSRYLGAAGLHYPNWEARSFEIGYWLRTGETGKGAMRETVNALTEYAFLTLNARRVDIHCDPNNVRSVRVAVSCGYTFEGRLRNASVTPAGAPRDTSIYGMTDADFRARMSPDESLLQVHVEG